MGYLRFFCFAVVILCVSVAGQEEKIAHDSTRPPISVLLTTSQSAVTRTSDAAAVKNDTEKDKLVKQPRRISFNYPTSPSLPWRHVSSSPNWATTSPMWYNHKTTPVYYYTSPDWYTRYSTSDYWKKGTSPEYRYTTPWWYHASTYPKYTSGKPWYHASTYPTYTSGKPWYHASTSPDYRYTTSWWHHASTYPHKSTPWYYHTTPWWYHASTYPHYKTTPWRYHGSTHPAYTSGTPWWHHASTYPHYKMTTKQYHASTPWWYHASTTYPHRKTTDWWYHKTTYPYYKHTSYYPYYTKYTTDYPYYTKTPYYIRSTPWWYDTTYATKPWQYPTSSYQPYKTTPWWYNSGTSPTPAWYYSTTLPPASPKPSGSPTYNQVLANAVVSHCSSSGWDITVDMLTLRQAYPTIKGSDIYLGENSCVGEEHGYMLIFRHNLRGCQTTEMVTGSNVVYRNQLIYAPRAVQPFNFRQIQWTVDVECDVGRNGSASAHIHHGRNNSHPHVTGTGSYDVRMSFYSDSNFVHEISGNPLQVSVGTLVYTKVYTTALDWNVKMKVQTCYTMANIGDVYPAKYDLIKNGCETDSNTHFIFQSTHETRFVFQDFESKRGQEGFDIKCDVTFCQASDTSPGCLQTCNPVGLVG